MIDRLDTQEVLSGCRQVLGLPLDQEQFVDDQLLAGLLRRSAGIHCPCSRVTLRVSILECLEFLSPDEEYLSDRVDAAIESLIIGGDLLELNDVDTADSSAKSTWVYAAPPSFVVRRNGSIFLFGIVPDQDAFLPKSILDHITYEGYTRTIRPNSNHDFIFELQEEGLLQLSENTWLKGPKKETATTMYDRYEQHLMCQPSSGHINDLKILDSERFISYYPGRWLTPTNQTGVFVARRPQVYGAAIWCFVQLKDGVAVRLLDFPLDKSRLRGCDTAWHLQMAIDHVRDFSQQYRRINNEDGVRFDFFSPLPQWSERRLMIFGRAVSRDRSLFSYLLPHSEAKTEEQYLQSMLWLSPTNDSD